jgi:hypothetical protein
VRRRPHEVDDLALRGRDHGDSDRRRTGRDAPGHPSINLDDREHGGRARTLLPAVDATWLTTAAALV